MAYLGVLAGYDTCVFPGENDGALGAAPQPRYPFSDLYGTLGRKFDQPEVRHAGDSREETRFRQRYAGRRKAKPGVSPVTARGSSDARLRALGPAVGQHSPLRSGASDCLPALAARAAHLTLPPLNGDREVHSAAFGPESAIDPRAPVIQPAAVAELATVRQRFVADGPSPEAGKRPQK